MALASVALSRGSRAIALGLASGNFHHFSGIFHHFSGLWPEPDVMLPPQSPVCPCGRPGHDRSIPWRPLHTTRPLLGPLGVCHAVTVGHGGRAGTPDRTGGTRRRQQEERNNGRKLVLCPHPLMTEEGLPQSEPLRSLTPIDKAGLFTRRQRQSGRKRGTNRHMPYRLGRALPALELHPDAAGARDR